MFYQQFVATLNAQRPINLFRIRPEAEKIFGFGTKDDFFVGHDRSNIESFRFWLKSPKDLSSEYPRYPRILYQDGLAESPKLIFRNACLPKVSGVFVAVVTVQSNDLRLLDPESSALWAEIPQGPSTSRPTYLWCKMGCQRSYSWCYLVCMHCGMYCLIFSQRRFTEAHY